MIPFVLFALFFFGLWLVLWNLLPTLSHAGQSLLRRFTRRVVKIPWVSTQLSAKRGRIQPYIPVIVILAAGLLIAGYVGEALVDLIQVLRAESPELTAVDERVYGWAGLFRGPSATRFFTLFTLIGTPVGLGAIITAVFAFLLWKKRFRWATYLVVTAGGGALLNLYMKAHFARTRPHMSEALRHASGFSFPSGHTMGSTVCAAALTYLAFRSLHTWKQKAACLAFAISFVLAVSLSRIYLGVHWISDIAAGLTAGMLWWTTTTLAYEVTRRIRALRKTRTAGS